MILQIFKELGDEFNGECCRVKITKISKKYKNFYKTTEFDGKEVIIVYEICELQSEK